MAKIPEFSQNLWLMKFSESFIMKITNSGLFVHRLKKQLKLVIFVRKPLLGEQRWTTTLPWKIYHFRKFLLFLHFKNPNNPYLPKISLHERICGIESESKLSTFFDTLCTCSGL